MGSGPSRVARWASAWEGLPCWGCPLAAKASSLLLRLAWLPRLGRGAPLHLGRALTAVALPADRRPLPSFLLEPGVSLFERLCADRTIPPPLGVPAGPSILLEFTWLQCPSVSVHASSGFCLHILRRALLCEGWSQCVSSAGWRGAAPEPRSTQQAQPCDGSYYMLPQQPRRRRSASSCVSMITHLVKNTARPYQKRWAPRAGTGCQPTADGATPPISYHYI